MPHVQRNFFKYFDEENYIRHRYLKYIYNIYLFVFRQSSSFPLSKLPLKLCKLSLQKNIVWKL